MRAGHQLDFDNGLSLMGFVWCENIVTNVIESKSEGFTYFSKADCGNRTPTHKAEE